LERAIANLQPEPALPCAARVFYCPTPVTLDSAGPLAYDFCHVQLVVDRQHAQALYIM